MGLFSWNQSVTKCKKCGTELGDEERLKRHVEKAHKKITEKCRACGAEFHTTEDLTKHKRKCK